MLIKQLHRNVQNEKEKSFNLRIFTIRTAAGSIFIANLIITFSGAVQNWNKKASDHEIGHTFCTFLKAAPRKVGVCIVKYLF